MLIYWFWTNCSHQIDFVFICSNSRIISDSLFAQIIACHILAYLKQLWICVIVYSFGWKWSWVWWKRLLFLIKVVVILWICSVLPKITLQQLLSQPDTRLKSESIESSNSIENLDHGWQFVLPCRFRTQICQIESNTFIGVI